MITDGQEGFDMRFCSLDGDFGAGNYFALFASYSTTGYQHKETKGQYAGEEGIFFASVLIGESDF